MLNEIEMPLKTLKQADKIMEKALHGAMDDIHANVSFTYNCGHCDDIHEDVMPLVVVLALLRANVDLLIESILEKTTEIQAIPTSMELYTGIIRHLYKNNTSNAELLHEALMEGARKDIVLRDIPAASVIKIQMKGWDD